MTNTADVFGRYRPFLFGLAYRMLGSGCDADDLVQETYLRWHQEQLAGRQIASPKAWLATVVTRLCIDHLRSAQVTREAYLGPWLPEPLATAEELDIAETALQRESLSIAFLVLLERLTPKERAIFLLHDVFAYPFAEIAPIVEETGANCRQVARRARRHIAAGRPRFVASADTQQRLAEHFVAATGSGDLSALIALLTEDVVLISDGGAKAQAARRPIVGADRVGRMLIGISRSAPPATAIKIEPLNGQLGIVARANGVPIIAIALALALAQDRIGALYLVVNPDKLRRLITAPV